MQIDEKLIATICVIQMAMNVSAVYQWEKMVWHYPTSHYEIQALECVTQSKEQLQFLVDMIDLVSKAKALVQERDKLDNEERETKRRHLVASSDSCEESNEFTEISISSMNNSNKDMSGPTPPPQLSPGYNI